jgi:hypothetical protein
MVTGDSQVQIIQEVKKFTCGSEHFISMYVFNLGSSNLDDVLCTPCHGGEPLCQITLQLSRWYICYGVDIENGLFNICMTSFKYDLDPWRKQPGIAMLFTQIGLRII